jgi:hypothetical protein
MQNIMIFLHNIAMDKLQAIPRNTPIGKYTVGNVIDDVAGGGTMSMHNYLRQIVGGSDDSNIGIGMVGAGIIALALIILYHSGYLNEPKPRSAINFVPPLGYEKTPDFNTFAAAQWHPHESWGEISIVNMPGMKTEFSEKEIQQFPTLASGTKVHDPRMLRAAYGSYAFVGYDLSEYTTDESIFNRSINQSGLNNGDDGVPRYGTNVTSLTNLHKLDDEELQDLFGILRRAMNNHHLPATNYLEEKKHAVFIPNESNGILLIGSITVRYGYPTTTKENLNTFFNKLIDQIIPDNCNTRDVTSNRIHLRELLKVNPPDTYGGYAKFENTYIAIIIVMIILVIFCVWMSHMSLQSFCNDRHRVERSCW